MSLISTTAKATIINLIRLILGILIIGAMLFWPASTWNYWQAWAWLAALFLPMIVSLVYLVKRDPALLERRTRTNHALMEIKQGKIRGAKILHL
jgi:peptidoglycan biosynthesis protein MviN/MurJ (putative lipid II flippase)